VNAAAIQLMAEKLRRDRRREQIREAVLQRFDFVPHRWWQRARPAERVRRLDVYAAVGEAVGASVLTNEFCREVTAVCLAEGAELRGHHGGGLSFRFMATKRKARVAPAVERLTAAQQRKLREDWARKLRESGFEDIETARGDLSRAGSSVSDPRDRYQVKAEINAGFFSAAQALYWRRDRELRVWELYAIDGLSIRDVAERLDLKRDLVHRIVQRVRGELAGQRTEGEDDDDAAEDD
jgi:DNA-directed RNA polymerase specialized sigma24 family protein